jgi:serine/threonine protein kinase/tetratricopeptide (TPR) repeat protein
VGDVPATLQAALTGRYAVERELGRGGMATVYLAKDLRHDRPVAFKVLHPELAQALGPERFQREIRFAARLQHPHILTVLDSGEHGGRLWFTMPFIQGESLRERLLREKQLPVEDALRIAREAADALDYAHQQGIVHRDIKPENIMLTGRHALVADFGIARAVGASSAQKLTETGMAVGTPAYMSPEQATGERELDGRSDIYSLGIVLYEMLAGEPPFGGATAQAMIARRFTETARPLRTVRETVPESVEEAVAKALAKAPADRFSTAGEFGKALEASLQPSRPLTLTTPAATPSSATIPTQPTVTRARPRFRSAAVLAVGFLLGLGVLLGWLRKHNSGAAEASGIKRLAVLPFENLGRPEDDYFADGITDEVRGKLASLPGLQVTASNSSSQYKKTAKTPQQIGQELGVQYLLVGKVRWEKVAGGQSRVRVSPELVQTSTASTRWQQPFDASLTDVFQVQADVASRVAQALDVALGTGEKQALAGRPTANLPAYDLYLQGNEAAGGFDAVAPVELRRAIGYYERAVALDSTFGLAWAQLSRAHTQIHWTGTPTAADEAKALASAERALALAPDLPEGHLALGDYYNLIKLEYGRALEEYSRGRKLAPNNAELLKGEGLVARSQGRWEESQAALTQAQALDPRSIGTARRLTYNLLRLRRYPEALEQADRALALDRSAPDLHQSKAEVLLAQGDLAGARRVLEAAQRDVEPTELVAWVSTYYDMYWVLNEAQQQLLLRLPPGPFNDDRLSWGLALAGTYAARGDPARAQAYGDSARITGGAQLRDAPDDAQLHVLQGTALAYAGRKAEAIKEGEWAVRLLPLTKDAYTAPYVQHQLARIYILVGEPEKALDRLEPLLKIPYYLSPGWLKVDPTFDPLRKNPRFQKLVAGTS